MHRFEIHTTWIGNEGSGTSSYHSYRRDHELQGKGKAVPIPGSSDPKFRGDGSRYNPEELLVGALSSCHMLWVLHLCSDSGIAVTAYEDNATGDMALNADGSGQFVEAVLRPRVTVADAGRSAELDEIHHKAHELCFISRSVNFPMRIEPA